MQPGEIMKVQNTYRVFSVNFWTMLSKYLNYVGGKDRNGFSPMFKLYLQLNKYFHKIADNYDIILLSLAAAPKLQHLQNKNFKPVLFLFSNHSPLEIFTIHQLFYHRLLTKEPALNPVGTIHCFNHYNTKSPKVITLLTVENLIYTMMIPVRNWDIPLSAENVYG